MKDRFAQANPVTNETVTLTDHGQTTGAQACELDVQRSK
jgi:hypothetical protein